MRTKNRAPTKDNNGCGKKKVSMVVMGFKNSVMGAGRPAKFETVEDFEHKVEAYFSQFIPAKEGEHKPRPENLEVNPTITGLCLFLGFESRQSYHDYIEKPEFSYAFKKSRMRIENIYEQNLFARNPAGSIFALKNMGWTDKQEIEQKTEHSGSINHTIDHSKLSDAALREIAILDKPEEGKD